MDDDHKRKLALGRTQAHAVRAYLALADAGHLNGNRPAAGDPERLAAEHDDLTARIAAEHDPLKRLTLIQRRLDVESAQAALPDVDVDTAEQAFIEHAAGYADRKGLSYPAFREAGVPAAVLKAAGIARTRRPSPR